MPNTRCGWQFCMLLVLASGACTNAMTAAPEGDRLQIGVWGGAHVALAVTEAGAHVEFDCAFGDISQPLTVDRDGRLTVDGVYVLERGPVRADREPERKPARYSGRLNGDRLTFDVTLIESNEIVGNFIVVYGVPPQGVRTCR